MGTLKVQTERQEGAPAMRAHFRDRWADTGHVIGEASETAATPSFRPAALQKRWAPLQKTIERRVS